MLIMFLKFDNCELKKKNLIFSKVIENTERKVYESTFK